MTEPVLPERAAEDRDEAWGEHEDEDDNERLEADRPPHHERPPHPERRPHPER